ncbi:MAG: Ig-like domain-containing protein, partial [Lachnospiraceae bacterium]|nr:Ig-like domain-containing protein [Lachnospiraceae bacterium]
MKKGKEAGWKKTGAWLVLWIFLLTAVNPYAVDGVLAAADVSSKASTEEEQQSEEAKPENMRLFSDKLTLILGEDTGLVRPVFSPEGTAEAVTYVSEDETVATVGEDGTITPVKEGTTIVNVTSKSGYTARCQVTVQSTDKEIADGEMTDGEGCISEDDNSSQGEEFSGEENISKEEVRSYLQLARAYSIEDTTEFALASDASIGISTEMTAVTAEALSPDIDTVLSSVKAYMLKNDTNPDYSSIWNVIGMERSGLGVPDTYKDTFYSNVIAYLEENNWEITKTKYSDYSKLIIGLTAIGIDAQNVCGHNLLSYLSDFTNVKRQGYNGPVWALIALHSHPSYLIPENKDATEQTTEEGLIEYILNRETTQGGWTLSGSVPDADMTGMTIQALAPYYNVRTDVTAALDRALTWLSSAQFTSTGGYGTLNSGVTVETSESASQVITALSALGIDCATDSRFIKNGKW